MKFPYKFVIILLTIIFVIFFGVPVIYTQYNNLRIQKALANFVDKANAIKQQEYQMALSDKVGGKTPKETLDLFIAAVEKGDYDLSSKYFVIPKQGEWKKRLQHAEKKDVRGLVNDLKIAKDRESISSSSAQMVVDKYAHPLVIDFYKYPSGNWKIDSM